MSTNESYERKEKSQEKEHLTNLIQMAMADGVIDEQEKTMIYRMAGRMGFTATEVDVLRESLTTSDYNPPYELEKRFEQLHNVIKISLADGVIDKNERALAYSFALKLGFEALSIPQLLDLLVAGIKDNQDEDELFLAFRKKMTS